MKIISFEEAAKLIKQGKIGVMPTDTVYGVVASALSPEAVGQLYRLKNRQVKPGTIVISSIQDLAHLGIGNVNKEILQEYWPGAVSIVLPSVTEYLHQGKGSLAVRLPESKIINRLLSVTGPLMTSSANTPGGPPSTTIKEAMSYFGDSVDFYVDGGYVSNEKASTVIQISDGVVEVLREGAVKLPLVP